MRTAAGAFFTLAAIYAAAPVAIALFLREDGRRTWAMSGPPPFDQWGSGPYLVWLWASLVLGGALLAGAGACAWRGRVRAAVPLAVAGLALPAAFVL